MDILYEVPDILPPIFACLAPLELITARLVCKKWLEVCRSAGYQCKLQPRVLVSAHYKLAEWALEVFGMPSPRIQQLICFVAIEYGAACFIRFVRLKLDWDVRSCAIEAAARGDVETLTVIEAENNKRELWATMSPTKVDRSRPRWVQPPSQFQWAGQCCIVAASAGHLAVLQHFIALAWPYYPGGLLEATIKAATLGLHWDLLAWVLSNERPQIEEVE